MSIYTGRLQIFAALKSTRLKCQSIWAQYKRLRQRTRSISTWVSVNKIIKTIKKFNLANECETFAIKTGSYISYIVWPKLFRFVLNKCTDYKLVFVRLWQFKLLLKSQDALQGPPTCAEYMLPTSLFSQVDPTPSPPPESTIRQTRPEILILVSFALAYSHFFFVVSVFWWLFVLSCYFSGLIGIFFYY